MGNDEAILRRIEIARNLEKARADYPDLWRRITTQWQESAGDCAWLTYSANYLLCTAGVRWALDPFSLASRMQGVSRPNFADDLKGLELVVLSHVHADHMDLDLVNSIAHLPIQWIIPAHMMPAISNKTRLLESQILQPQNGVPIVFRGLVLTPFDSPHIHGNHGVPETGYLVEFGGKRWLFPGDIRVYNNGLLPRFGDLTGVFAHLWLGRNRAMDEIPALLDAFIHFYISMNPGRIIISHLQEFGRDEKDYWDQRHYQMAAEKIRGLAPGIKVESAQMGDKVIL